MYYEAYWIMPQELMFLDKQPKLIFQKYYYFIWLFPRKEVDKIFVWLNKDFINKVEKLKTFLNIRIYESRTNKKIWFTKNWFKYFWAIELTWKNLKDLEKDYNFIKENLENNLIYK